MRTLLLLGVATGALLLTDTASSATFDQRDSAQSTTLVAVPSITMIARGHHDDASLDYDFSDYDDDRVYSNGPDRMPTERDYREWRGERDHDGADYHHDDARREDAHHDNARGDHHQDDDRRYASVDDERYERELSRACRPSRGLTGTVLGGVLGGFLGNRIDRRGNRTFGTLLGGVMGAGLGKVIEQAGDKRRCSSFLDHARSRYGAASSHGSAHGSSHHGGNYYHGQSSGYGYYTPGVVVTTIIMPAQQVITEEYVTKTVTYHPVATPKRRHVAHKKVARPKRRATCTCR